MCAIGSAITAKRNQRKVAGLWFDHYPPRLPDPKRVDECRAEKAPFPSKTQQGKDLIEKAQK
jgi:hypothetical protein